MNDANPSAKDNAFEGRTSPFAPGSTRNAAFSEDELKRILASDPQADQIFDSHLPDPYRAMANRQWTTAAVVRQVAHWLAKHHSHKKIIDIGSGVGKFCILLGLHTRMEVHGIEQRKSLYEISLRLRNDNFLKNVTFIHGNMVDMHWEDYDIYYLYNPFQEHLVNNGWSRINGDITFAPSLFGKYIDEIFRQLVWVKKGKLLITFHGYGGIVPSTWDLIHRVPIRNGDLCMWEKKI